MSKTMERISFVLTWIFQGPSYLSAYGYGIMHRMHHAHTDTEKDPHSPSHDANLFAMMWKTKTIYQCILLTVKCISMDMLILMVSGNVHSKLYGIGCFK